MGRRRESLRGAATAKIGALVAVLALTLIVPSIAFAANTATFSGVTPQGGSSTTVAKPTISVIVYDRYGVTGSTNYTMWLHGVRVPATITRYSGWGYRKFKLSYAVPSALALGDHRVTVRVKDLKLKVSTYSWLFTTTDGVAPVTTSDVSAVPYTGSATIHLSPSDNVGVAHTYYMLDTATVVEGRTVTVSSTGAHVLMFWSVDAAGNVENKNITLFSINAAARPFVHATPAISCTVAGCHADLDLASIHIAKGCAMCHGTGVTPLSNCINCHGASPVNHTAATHPAIVSVPTLPGAPACSQATCHGAVPVVTTHKSVCATCHGSSNAAVVAAISGGHATCESCHTTPFATVHAAGTAKHAVSGTCYNSLCHAATDVSVIHTRGDDAPGCVACHGPGVTPSLTCATTTCHPNLPTVHDFVHVNATGTKSSACTSCHGTDLPTVHAPLGCFCHTGSLFDLSGEMGPLLAAGTAECVSCHTGPYAAHGFNQTASGHNTSTYGRVGAFEKFDGVGGNPLLKWESEIASATLPATWPVEGGFQPAERPEGITSVTVGQEGTVTTDWDFPTVNVFWASNDASAPAGAMKGLTKNSSITCQDCHTGLNAAGPHGASDNWGIDPNFPSDYSYAELTKQVTTYPSGIKLRSTLTTATQTYASGMTMICSKCHDLENYQSGTTVNSPLPLLSTGSVPFVHNGETFTPVFVSGSRGGWTVYTDIAGHPVAAGTGQAWTQAATGTLNTAAVGSSNTAHSSHHQDQADGSAQCVNCHIGVPHGWKRPRLLVNTGWNGGPSAIGAGVIAGDAAPYRSPNALGTTRTNGGIAINPATGFNGMGMLTLSAVDNHRLQAGSTFPGGSALPAGMVYNTGAAYWSEPSCQACNDHAGEDGIRIIDTP